MEKTVRVVQEDPERDGWSKNPLETKQAILPKPWQQRGRNKRRRRRSVVTLGNTIVRTIIVAIKNANVKT